MCESAALALCCNAVCLLNKQAVCTLQAEPPQCLPPPLPVMLTVEHVSHSPAPSTVFSRVSSQLVACPLVHL